MNEVEIIIPAYNAHNTIGTTLDSIIIQKETPNYHVTIVNDNGKDYKQIVDKYKDMLNITEIKTDENGGPGLSRQYGIDNTNSKYIVFIDSDDYLYDEYSLKHLYNKINNTQADLVISTFIYERDGIRKEKKKDTIWLHGKIYKRSFLEKNNIRFNNTRANEDNGFNSLILLLHPVIVLTNEITYVYKENPNSITRKNNRDYKLSGLEGLSYNINWAIEEAKKRNVSINDLAWKTSDGLLAMYKNYNILFDNPEKEKIIDWSKELYKKYLEYEPIIKSIEEQMLEDSNIEKEYITYKDFKELINKKIKM